MKPVVVLLHGLARTHRSLVTLQRAIDRAGYQTWSETYPSRRAGVRELADEVAARIRADLPGRELLGVTHSLGGILVRCMADALPWRGVVMIAPPNNGSRVAAALGQLPAYRWFYGAAGQDVRLERDWPAPPMPFSVIAGTRSLSPSNPVSWLTNATRLFPRDIAHDGTVAVDETRLPGMASFDTVDADHTWIMNHPETLALVLRFLAERAASH